MGIMNVTPDSFYAGSRAQTEDSIRARIREIVSEGGDIIDLGAYSTRPGADEISEEEEKARLFLECIEKYPSYYPAISSYIRQYLALKDNEVSDEVTK